MNHLVVTVSKDSSIELLSKWADVIILDDHPQVEINKLYHSLYIRSHFSTPKLQPLNFKQQTDAIIAAAKQHNPGIHIVDAMDSAEKITQFEDKLQQSVFFKDFLPRTALYSSEIDPSSYLRPLFKKRLSSRGLGVTWSVNEASQNNDEWLIQESIAIAEELRMYYLRGEVIRTGAIHKSLSHDEKVEVTGSRELHADEMAFVASVMQNTPFIEFAGLDVARSTDGSLWLMEVNRSPGFAKFYDQTGINLADSLYGDR